LPPFPKILGLEKPLPQPKFDLLEELRNMCVKIPLFQTIKNVPIYSQTIKELCIINPSRKRKNLDIVHVIGHLVDLMTRKIFMAKYSDPGIPVVDVQINKTCISNTLIYLGVSINVIMKETMNTLGLFHLIQTPMVL
jgi:hypothetical protein